MYPFDACSEPGCRALAFAGLGRCAQHLADRPQAFARAAELLTAGGTVKDLSLGGLVLDGLDLSKRRFVGCTFMGSSFRSVLFTNSTLILCFFDGSTIESCDFSTANAQFCSFGGCELHNSSFENSELLHCNFDGSKIREGTFNGSNLYDSRFIRCELENSDFVDCDLKRVYMIPAKQSGVSFKGSNTMEAIKDLEHLYL
jgi:uncharacterized protein YjbI with pentapeptide repeats